MDPRQILILLLCLEPVWTCMHQCCDEDQLIEVAQKRLKRFPQPPELAATPGASTGCPLELYQALPAPTELSQRSVSPWRYIIVNMTDHFPPTYVKAECLCNGCILFQDKQVVESNDYNSVTLTQTRMFLKRVRCPGETGYRLEPVSVKVPVGCTCVRANS